MADSSSRNASYWKSYRRVRSNVDDHLSAIYSDASYSINPEQSMCSDHDQPGSSSNQCEMETSITGELLLQDVHAHFENDDDVLVNSVNTSDRLPGLISSNDDVIEDQLHGYISDTLSTFSDSDLSVHESDVDAEESLENELKTWATTFKITHSALQSLLTILRTYHPFLPKDPRTLLKTGTKYNVIDIDGGLYYHFGLGKGILEKIVASPFDTLDIKLVQIQFNIDGLPLFKSSNAQFWPILCRIVEPFESKPFVVGLFSGNQKPGNVNEYLQFFRDDLNNVLQAGISVPETDQIIDVEILCIICDTPARAFVKQTKGHSGYFGCDKCCQRGHWSGKVTFPEVDSALRTDVMFDELQNEEHHIGHSPLSGLSIGMVSQFPIDYMHLVCLGVTRRLLLLWMKGPLRIRQGNGFIAQISTSILEMVTHMPREFLRKGRKLQEVERWKATEFRLFLLYLGPVVLKNRLPCPLYKHFMLLSVGIFCLVSPIFWQTYCEYAKQLLCLFVCQIRHLYGEDQYVYNIHGLIHLADDVERFGPLDKFSSFAFESFLGRLKKLVRKPSFPLQQIIRRLSENCLDDCKDNSGLASGIVKMQHNNGPKPRNYAGYMQFEQLDLPGSFFLSIKNGNNCILAKGGVCLIRNILSPGENSPDRVLLVEHFKDAKHFYSEPLNSSDLCVFQVNRLSGEIKPVLINEITCKCILLPYKNMFVAMPLVHSFIH